VAIFGDAAAARDAVMTIAPTGSRMTAWHGAPAWEPRSRVTAEGADMDRTATLDLDPAETREWLDSLEGVIEVEGQERAAFLLDELLGRARRRGTPLPYSATTPYLNTIPPDRQARHPGDRAIEHRIRSYIRWNALALVLRANKESSELGGHIASFQSAATLYDVGFMHFWYAPSPEHDGILLKRMEECVDGEYQDFKSKNGAYVREHFFGKYPELRAMVADMSDDEIWALTRGGHDPLKICAAYHEAVRTKGRPTVILAKTVKGYGMGEAGEGRNITHQQKKMGETHLREFRDRFSLPLTDQQISEVAFLGFDEGSAELAYLRERRRAFGGSLPARRRTSSRALEVPPLSAFDTQLKGTGEREISTTMAFVRILNTLLRDKKIGRHVVPVVPDESRTFGMEGMFRQFGIYSQVGQLYRPEDADQLMFYKEDRSGQILQEGINKPGAMASWIAAATSYSVSDVPMIPFYISSKSTGAG
jgi:pyruvate dehydrogenase complex dehydrogenase (E1) component